MRDFLREDVLFKALKFAAVASLAVAPNMVECYFFNAGYREVLLGMATESSLPYLFLRDLLLSFFSLAICSACGFAWSDGKKVAGFGTLQGLRKDGKTLLPLGLALALATAVLFDKGLTGDFPRLYPKSPIVAVAIPLRAAFFEETVCRFGMLVIAFRLLRSVPAAILLSSAFNVGLGLRSAIFVGFPLGLDLLTAAILAAKFGVAAFFGYFFCRKGLLATISLRFIMELKHVVFALTGW